MLLKKYYKLFNMSQQKINTIELFGNDLAKQLILMKAKFNLNNTQSVDLDILYDNYKRLLLDVRSTL